MNRPFRIPVILVAAHLVGACRSRAPHDLAPPAPEPARNVRVGLIARTGGQGSESVPAVVAARERATLAARIAATLVELPFREGQRVVKGSVVVRLDDTALRAAEAAAESAAKAADIDLARIETLLAKNAATARERDEAMARAAAARAAVLGARDSLSYAVLRAPFDGVVASRPVHVGDVVAPGAPLLEVEAEGGFEIRATVAAGLATSLHPGQTLTGQVDGQESPAVVTVRAIGPAADASTHRVELHADVASAPGLRSGLFARLAIPRLDAAARLTVPSDAIVERGGLTGVFVVGGDKVRLRWVAVGEARQGVTELRAGADVGERIVIDPTGLVDGARVEVVP
jgi:RND family efflux transporter MFP subunit